GGGAKSPEGLRWLAGYHRAQRRPAGAARVRFGEPLSLRDALAAAGDGPTRTEKVAFTICDGINRATPFTASSLVTFALLGARDARGPDAVGRAELLHRRRRAGLVDRPRPPSSGRLLPQRRRAPLRQPRDRRAGAAGRRQRRGGMGGGPAAARPAQVRILLR